jgi:DNA helicase-2/ATP-dependent DNA helicase PcrA
MSLNLNKGQAEAVKHVKGPCIVIAPPGSGKTFVITQRTRYLIEECGINPANILVITFTKAAATEMKERFAKVMGKNTPVSFGTFHAIFFTILRYAYGFKELNF